MEAEVASAQTEPATAPKTTDVANELAVSRLRFIRGATLFSLLLLVVSLGFWQLVRSAESVAREQRQNQRRIALPAPRGVIYDREHRVLAGNRVRLDAVLPLGPLQHEFLLAQKSLPPIGNGAEAAPRARWLVVQGYLDRVNALTGRSDQITAAQLERHFARDRLTPLMLAENLSAAEGARLAAALAATGPVQLTRSTQRWYPHGHTAAHVLGRVRRETGRAPVGRNQLRGQFIGTAGESGIEKQFDAQLQGSPGESVIRVDAWGFPSGSPLAHHPPTPGSDVVLSLDLDLQLAAERTMAETPAGSTGAAVAISVANGEILALVSKPDFDLNTVSPDLGASTKQRIDATGGWINRATQGLYPPGSTFKIFTAMAGLRHGTLRPDDVLRCDGFLDLGGQRFPCHNAQGHGDVSLRTALAQSCNVFAYRTGLAAGADALAAEARRFHFGERTGIELPFESPRMLVPDPAWKQAAGLGPWNAGDTANFSIGQGFLRFSPLQAACAMASLARRESLTVPTLLWQPARSPTGDRVAEPLGLAEGDYAALLDGLQAVIDTGIGQDAQVPGVRLAGKTGTAQVVRKEGMMNVAWFVAFAPAERPEIAVAVAIEGGQPGVEFDGARYAAPVVREIIGTYFDKRAHHP